jgi:hypothetical protein
MSRRVHYKELLNRVVPALLMCYSWVDLIKCMPMSKALVGMTESSSGQKDFVG